MQPMCQIGKVDRRSQNQGKEGELSLKVKPRYLVIMTGPQTIGGIEESHPSISEENSDMAGRWSLARGVDDCPMRGWFHSMVTDDSKLGVPGLRTCMTDCCLVILWSHDAGERATQKL